LQEAFIVKLRDQAIRAAETILTQCLALPPGARAVVFGDETTMNVVSILTQVAVNLQLRPILACFSTQTQVALGDEPLDSVLETVLDNAAAALICLDGRPACFPFRDTVRRTAWNPGCKVAHMPGVSLSTLLLADVDYEVLSTQCEMLALALVKGQQIKIISRDHRGDEHCLKAILKPYKRFPIISDGVIQAGSWGNVPSGEVYVAPPEGSAEGSIVINGSLPGYCIRHGEEIILRFQEGQLAEWTPLDSPAMQHLQRTQIEFARSRGDWNWSNLAEIGLGVNPRVRGLTGNPLIDEKKYGSVHVALGDNLDMGGEVKSSIHCDMVSLSPRVSIDGKVILEGGAIVQEAKDWREDHRELSPPEAWRGDFTVICTATDAHVDEQGCLRRLWDTSSGRVCSVPVGNDETARMAANVYQLIQTNGQAITVGDLACRQQQIDVSQVIQLTYLLKLYGLVSVHDSEL
jgi:aminopeptidase